jgi:LacI family transcriptional regulator
MIAAEIRVAEGSRDLRELINGIDHPPDNREFRPKVNYNVNSSSARRITMREIATLAGVSVMSVSRALRHGRQVAPEVRARIQEIAEKHGYQPDPAMTALCSYRLRMRPPSAHTAVAYLTTNNTRGGYQADSIMLDAFNGAQQRGAELGYRVEPVWFNELTRRGLSATEVLLARGFKGLIVAKLPSIDLDVWMNWQKFSCVAIGYSLRKPALHFVASHLFQVMLLAFAKALEHGYKRPGFLLTEDLNERTLHQFHGAFLSEQQRLPVKDRLPVGWTTNSQLREDAELYLEKYRPDVLLSMTPVLLGELQKIGLKIPRDLGYVDLHVVARDSGRAGVYQDLTHIGRTAMDRLHFLMQEGERGPPTVPLGTTLHGEWISGPTLLSR